MIDTYKLRNVLEMLVFVIANILCSDVFLVPYIMLLMLYVYYGKLFAILVNPDLVYVLYVSLLIILLLRFTLLPFIYAIFEKMGQNDKIKKFITDLKTNAKYRKKCFWTMFLICMLSNQLIYLTMMIGTLSNEKIISEFWEILLTFTVIILVGPYSILYLFYKFGKKKN